MNLLAKFILTNQIIVVAGQLEPNTPRKMFVVRNANNEIIDLPGANPFVRHRLNEGPILDAELAHLVSPNFTISFQTVIPVLIP